MHGFCTDFARFQNVQRVLFAAKSDKGCRNYRVKNHDISIENCDKSKHPEIETNLRLALLISGSWVRVPDGAPKQTPRKKLRGVFLLQFPGTLRTGAPSGTRTGRVGRFAYRPTTKPRWGFVSPRESPRGIVWEVRLGGGGIAPAGQNK